MNEIYSKSVSRKILISLLFIILLLSFYSSGLPFHYFKFLFTINKTAINSFFLPLRFIFIIYILFSIVKKRIPYIPFLIILLICAVVSVIKKSIQLNLFLNIFCIYGLFSVIHKKAYNKNNRILFFAAIITLCPFIMTTKSFDIELFKFVIFEISLLFIFLTYLKENIPIQKNRFDKLIIGYLIFNFLLILIHKLTLISIIEFKRIIIFTSFFYLVLSFPFQKKEIGFLINAMLIVSVIISLYGIMQSFGIDVFKWEEGRVIKVLGYTVTRSSSTFAQPNALASYLIMIIPLTFYMVLNAKWKWLYIIVLFFNSICLITSFSRGGIIGFVVSGSIILFVKKIKQHLNIKKIIILTGAFLLIISIAVLLLIFISGKQRIDEFQLKGKRIGIYMTTVNMIKKNLLFGVGPGNFKIYFDKYKTEDLRLMAHGYLRKVTHAHSEFLEILAEKGVIGFLFYLYILYVLSAIIFRRLWREKELFSLTTALSIGVYSVFVQNVVSIELRGYIIPIIFVFYSGLLFNKEVINHE